MSIVRTLYFSQFAIKNGEVFQARLASPDPWKQFMLSAQSHRLVFEIFSDNLKISVVLDSPHNFQTAFHRFSWYFHDDIFPFLLLSSKHEALKLCARKKLFFDVMLLACRGLLKLARYCRNFIAVWSDDDVYRVFSSYGLTKNVWEGSFMLLMTVELIPIVHYFDLRWFF